MMGCAVGGGDQGSIIYRFISFIGIWKALNNINTKKKNVFVSENVEIVFQ